MPAIADSWQDCVQTKDPDLAIEACTNFLETAQGDQVIRGYYGRAIAYFNKHDFYHAVKDFDEVISKKEVISKNGLQLAYIDQGLAYENQMADDPAFADLAIFDLTEADKLEAGVEDKTKAQFWQAYLVRAETNLKKGEDDQALADEARAIRLSPDKEVAIKADFAQAYKRRAWRNLAGGQYDRAVSDLQQAIHLDPTTSDKLTPYLTEAQSGQPGPYSAIARGDLHEEDQDYEQALNDYTEAIKAKSDLADAHLDRGEAYEALDHFKEAGADFDEAIRLDPNGWLGYYASGELYQSTDQFDKAGADFDKASAIIEKAHDWGYEYEKRQIDDARKSLKFTSTLEDHWISYLKEIQAAETYLNWSDAPYDLYDKHHKITECCQAAPDTHSPTSPEASLIQPWVLSMVFAVLLLTGLAFVWRYRWSHAKPLPIGPPDSVPPAAATSRVRLELRGRLIEKGGHTEEAKVATTSSDSGASRLKGTLTSLLKGTLTGKRRS